MPDALFAVADETLVGTVALAAITALSQFGSQVVGWLKGRDEKLGNAEKAALVTDLTHLKTEVAECKEDRAELRKIVTNLNAKLDAAADRERGRHPLDESIPAAKND